MTGLGDVGHSLRQNGIAVVGLAVFGDEADEALGVAVSGMAVSWGGVLTDSPRSWAWRAMWLFLRCDGRFKIDMSNYFIKHYLIKERLDSIWNRCPKW